MADSERDLPAYSVRRSARARRLLISVSQRRGVEVVLPLHARAGPAEIARAVEGRREWIFRALTRLQVAPSPPPPFAARESIPYLGIEREIFVRRGPPGVALDDAAILIWAPVRVPAGRVFEGWARGRARELFMLASDRWERLLGVRRSALRIGDPRTRWGSCSSRGTLSYCWRVVMAPPEVLDCLALHEVAHLRHPNHGQAFWKLVARHCAAYKEHRAWLLRHGPALRQVAW